MKRIFYPLSRFYSRCQGKKPVVCILTGAGTSEFIGYCVEGLFRKHLCLPTNVVSTTKIVTNPSDFFIKGYNTLLVSFARSGNSPESIGAVRIADTFSGNLSHLVITCNRDGDLMREAVKIKDSLCIDLNEKTKDHGLAMTSSFTNMVVASQALTFIHRFGEYARNADGMVEGAHRILKDTVGAGDLFGAAFLFFYMKKFPIELCIILGAANAASTVRFQGGTIGQRNMAGSYREYRTHVPLWEESCKRDDNL